MKIFADTNVIVSMLLWGKSLEQLFVLINARKITLGFSPATIEELFRVVNYPQIAKQALKQNVDAEVLADKLVAASEICYPSKTFDIVADDPSDNKILETALEAKAEYIISGDRHLLQLKTF